MTMPIKTRPTVTPNVPMSQIRERQQFRTDTGWSTALGDATPTDDGRVRITHRTASGFVRTDLFRPGRKTTVKK